MICPKCHSENVSVSTSAYQQSKNRSCLWNLFMIFCTAGLWLVWMMVRGRKEKHIVETYATCQDCGHRWKV